jgi:SAM-dependent methyltransferase
MNNIETGASLPAPSPWVLRFLPLIRPGGRVLDLAAGNGRHVRLLRERGFTVTAIDRDIEALRPLAGPDCEIREIDLETGAPWPLGGGWDGIIVTRYLYRPLLPDLAGALAADGVLVYETFMLGNERFGRPDKPEFLLRPGELLAALAGLTILAFEQGEIAAPRPAMIQRLCARRGPPGPLPA